MGATYKSTTNLSKIDAYIEILEDLNVYYTIENTTTVNIYQGWFDNVDYTLRKLQFNRYIVLEKIIREHHELNDTIISEKFYKEAPEDWKYEIVKEYPKYEYECDVNINESDEDVPF